MKIGLNFVLFVLIFVMGISILPVKAAEKVKVYINIEAEPVQEVTVNGYMVFENHYPIRNELLGCRDCLRRYKGWATMVATYTEKIYVVGYHYERIEDDVKIIGIDCLREEAIGSQPYKPEDIVTLPIPSSGHLAEWEIYPGGWKYDSSSLSFSRTHYWRENVDFLASNENKEYAYLTTTYRTRIIDLGSNDYLLTNCVITCLPEKEVVNVFDSYGDIPPQYRIGYANLLYEDIDFEDPNCWSITHAKILTSREGFQPDLSVSGYNISRSLGEIGYYWISGGWIQKPLNFSKKTNLVRVKGIVAITEDGKLINGIPPTQTFLLEDPYSWLEIAEKTKWDGYEFDPSSSPGNIFLRPY